MTGTSPTKHTTWYEPADDQCVGWGAPYFEDDPQTSAAQVAAAAAMMGPVLVEYIICASSSCDMRMFDGRPPSSGVIAYAVLLPGSVANHLTCALRRRWVPLCQKADRIGVTIAVAIQCWALSQSMLYTAVGALLSASYVFLVTCSPPRFRDNQEAATLIVGAIVVYGAGSMLVTQGLDLLFLLAVAALLSGFAVFLRMPAGPWTDAVWHLLLAVYAVFTGLALVRSDRRLYGGCQ
mmetsp:Transcript_123670/g.385079  ORF Transcript_123670/g.385079 Transcript_123670/m.385079 type:complete len:236 (+) Transcript_123670:69-776(+)